MKSRRVARHFLRRTVAVVGIIALIVIGLDVGGKKVVHNLFPLKYEKEITEYCTAFGVDKSLTYAMIKCESNFDPKAESSAGAVGVMQLTPDTFRFITERLYDFKVNSSLIYDDKTNIKCGIWYISYLNVRFSYSTSAVVAAYNAGPEKVKKWLENPEYSSDGKSLESAPYEETRNHIKKVETVQKIYKKIYNI